MSVSAPFPTTSTNTTHLAIGKDAHVEALECVVERRDTNVLKHLLLCRKVVVARVHRPVRMVKGKLVALALFVARAGSGIGICFFFSRCFWTRRAVSDTPGTACNGGKRTPGPVMTVCCPCMAMIGLQLSAISRVFMGRTRTHTLTEVMITETVCPDAIPLACRPPVPAHGGRKGVGDGHAAGLRRVWGDAMGDDAILGCA